MKQLLYISLGLFFSIAAFSQVEITINCGSSSSYCRGIPPEDDETTLLNTPKTIAMHVYLYATDNLSAQKPILVFSGNNVKVNPGKYIVSVLSNLTSAQINDYNSPKLSNIGKTNDEVNLILIEIKNEGKQTFDYNYHYYCPWQLNPNIAIPN